MVRPFGPGRVLDREDAVPEDHDGHVEPEKGEPWFGWGAVLFSNLDPGCFSAGRGRVRDAFQLAHESDQG